MRQTAVDLPLVDEEYSELVAVYQAALRATHTFVMAELGARWGTWGARAVSYLRRFNPSVTKYDLLYVEPDGVAADGLRTVHQMNNITDYTLIKGLADVETLQKWAARHERIDLIDMDIQGAEEQLLPALEQVLTSKVRRLIVGTHSKDIHASVRNFIVDTLGWSVVHQMPFTNNGTCVETHLRASINLDEIKRQGCYTATPFGNVVQWDGEIVADNPRFEGDKVSDSCKVWL